MAIPNLPIAVQINWTDEDTSPPWNDPIVNTFSSRLRKIDIEQRAFRGSLRSDTCVLTFQDALDDLIPSKVGSSLESYILLGRRVRALRQTAIGSGEWEPWFFGYVRDYQMDTRKRAKPDNVIVCDGPLAALNSLQIALPPSQGAVVYDAADPDHSGLWLLLKEAGLWGTPYVQLDNVGAVALPDDWAGTGGDDPLDPDNWEVKSFTEWLGILARTARCFAVDEPRLAVAADDPDWVLRWYQPSPAAAADFALSAPAGNLEPTPRISFNGEVTF